MKYVILSATLLLTISFVACKKPNNGGIVDFTCICGGGIAGIVDTTTIKATSRAAAEAECTKGNSSGPNMPDSYSCVLQ